MTNPSTDETFTDLEIRVFQQGDEGYPVEITLGGQQEFPRGRLSADILPWVPTGDLRFCRKLPPFLHLKPRLQSLGGLSDKLLDPSSREFQRNNPVLCFHQGLCRLVRIRPLGRVK